MKKDVIPDLTLRVTGDFKVVFIDFLNGKIDGNPTGKTFLISQQYTQVAYHTYFDEKWGYTYNVLFSVISKYNNDYYCKVESVL